ncbi:unnamed protein product, partial [Effrenium voratum]
IHQADEVQKGRALVSLGGFLKNSKSLLVLLDASYTRRLWCIIELAAYLKCHEGGRGLRVIPTFMGPAAVGMQLFFVGCLRAWMLSPVTTGTVQPYLAVLLVACYVCIGTLRTHYSERQAGYEHLKNFR